MTLDNDFDAVQQYGKVGAYMPQVIHTVDDTVALMQINMLVNPANRRNPVCGLR